MKIVGKQKNLPNGSISAADIRDLTVRKAFMLMNENIVSLKEEVNELRECIRENQK